MDVHSSARAFAFVVISAACACSATVESTPAAEGDRPSTGGSAPEPSEPERTDAVTPDSGRSDAGRSDAARPDSGTPRVDAGGVSIPDESAAQLCVDTINAYRKTLNLPPYARWTAAESCSDGEAQSDSQTNKAHGAFGRCGESAQNECPGWSGSKETVIRGCLQMMWNEGPGGGHYENMRSTRYTRVACGFHVTSAGRIWSVQNFK